MYLYSPDNSVSGASYKGVPLEMLNGRFWVDDEEAVAVLASHGLVPHPDQSEDPTDSTDTADEPAADGAPRRGRPSKSAR